MFFVSTWIVVPAQILRTNDRKTKGLRLYQQSTTLKFHDWNGLTTAPTLKIALDWTVFQQPSPNNDPPATMYMYFFFSIFTGSLIHEHYTRECEFGNFDNIKNKNNTKKQNNTKNTKTFG